MGSRSLSIDTVPCNSRRLALARSEREGGAAASGWTWGKAANTVRARVEDFASSSLPRVIDSALLKVLPRSSAAGRPCRRRGTGKPVVLWLV